MNILITIQIYLTYEWPKDKSFFRHIYYDDVTVIT